MSEPRTFIGYRPKVPVGYIEGGYGNLPDEPQYEGVVFSDGTTVLRWLTEFRSTSVWSSFAEMAKVHGHPDYETHIEWLDGGPSSSTVAPENPPQITHLSNGLECCGELHQ
jgi:hypothetical protein